MKKVELIKEMILAIKDKFNCDYELHFGHILISNNSTEGYDSSELEKACNQIVDFAYLIGIEVKFLFERDGNYDYFKLGINKIN